MNRLQELIRFVESDVQSGSFIEPPERLTGLCERVFDVVETYRPSVIVKAGLGRGELVSAIAQRFDAYLVVVEPSFALASEFLERHREDPWLPKVRFITGDFESFPVDYYAADMVICTDYLNLMDSSRCIDEFRRALQFEGIFIYGDVVLAQEDIDGRYDELCRMLLPLHNEYYLDEELRTVLELKDFSFVKGMLMRFPRDISALTRELAATLPEAGAAAARDFIETHREELIAHYQLDGASMAQEHYFVGCFMRNKPKKAEAGPL